jgi:hypothetical protein
MSLFRTCHIYIRLVLSFLLIFTMGEIKCFAQRTNPDVFAQNEILFSNMKVVATDSGFTIAEIIRQNCKGSYTEIISFPETEAQSVLIPVPVAALPAKPKFLIIHGNISYDYFYRSKIDTPFNQQDLQQHTERVWLDLLFKEKYPFKVGFNSRQSNSPFFRDLYNANLNFDKYNYLKGLKLDLLKRLAQYQLQNPDLKLADTALKYELQKLEALKASLNSAAALQRKIEAKEAAYLKKLKEQKDLQIVDSVQSPEIKGMKFGDPDFAGKMDSLKLNRDEYIPDSDAILAKKMQNTQHAIDSLEKSVAKLKYRSDSIRTTINNKVAKAKQQIYGAKNPNELEHIALQNDIVQPKKEKAQKFLADIKSFGIGRNMIDYTELTAQNVMLTGINVEYNPSYYAAFAAGKIDFGFRDFLGRNTRKNNQYLTLGRFGWGSKDKRSIILTVFNGKKSNYANFFGGTESNNTSKLFGYSVEAIFKKSEYTSFSVEIAKSTKFNSGIPVRGDSVKSDNLFKYNDNSNMGINLKARTVIQKTNTLISGFYRKTGVQFQSFSLFTYNTTQESWQLRAEQSFLKNKVNAIAMLRENDFTNPLTEKTFKTSTVFKTLQLNVKVPHWPVLNAGYFPGSQFYVVDKETVRENVYYILNGSVLYPYTFKDLSMSSSVMYNRYFNKSTDSGFVLYKGINYMINHSVFMKNTQLQGSYSYNRQAEIKYSTLEASADYTFKKILKAGGGIKYNQVRSGSDYWGETIRLGADLKKLGGIQLSYEKSYLPTIQQTLYPVEIGRVSWYKFF